MAQCAGIHVFRSVKFRKVNQELPEHSKAR